MSAQQTVAQTTPRRAPRGPRVGDASRIEAGLPFVEALARRMASTMPHSIDLSDLVQDGVLGLMDAAERFDEGRGIKFETFAERRIRGAMIDALRKDAWPRGVRRVRRELEAAREKLRLTLGHEPSLADLASEIGADEKRLSKTIVRINTIESTSPLSCGDNVDESHLPAVLVPAEPERPDLAYERTEVRTRVRGAIDTLPARERRVISLYYYGEVTMKEIGAELGVNESRVSQLHARALRRLRESLHADAGAVLGTPVLGSELTPAAAVALVRTAVLAFEARPKMARARLRDQAVAAAAAPLQPSALAARAVAATIPESDTMVSAAAHRRGVVVDYATASRAARSKSPNRNGLASQRQPVSSRNVSASVPATAPVTKITRRARPGVTVAIAR
jgi:RNA polymerase sigma factor for flagellar operon FliA